MSRAWTLPAFGAANLRLGEEAAPDPGPGEVRLRLRAVSLNYRDHLMVEGAYNPRQALPLIPCSDAVGVVDAVGPGVTRFVRGDRACPIFSQSWLGGEPDEAALRSTLGGPLPGTLREAMVVPEAGLVRPPSHLSDAEAACLPCAAVTAWRALEGVQAGDTVLTQGTGGVSLFALQLAVARGARVGVTSRGAARRARALALGAEVAFDTAGAWGREAAAWTGGRGVDRVIELGGASTLDESLRAVRVGGTLSVIGVLGGAAVPLALTKVLMRSVRLQGIFVGSRADFEALNAALCAAPQVRPVVDRVFPFEAAPEAFVWLAAGAMVGKVVVGV